MKVAHAKTANYWLVSSTGQVFAYGKARRYGSEYRKHFKGKIAGIAGTSDGKGYWIVTSRRKAYAFGDATRRKYNKRTKLQKYRGSVRPRGLHGRIVGIAVAMLPATTPPVSPVTTTSPVPTTTTTPGDTTTTPTTTDACDATDSVRNAGAVTDRTADEGTTPVIGTTTLPDPVQGESYSVALSATGGSGGDYKWSLASGSSPLPSGLSLAINGTLSASDVSAAPGSYSFTVEVTDGDDDTAQQSYSIVVANPEQALNWSGYAETSAGSAYTSASGTFTVPSLDSEDSDCEGLAEWVGIDGYERGDDDLIQAGVGQDPVDGTYAWWEILPADATPIETMTVSPGDSVTVTLTETATPCHHGSDNDWTISLVDDSQPDDSFTTSRCYTGPADSAEWIVEAPTEGFDDNSVYCQVGVAQFSPAVEFSDLATSQSSPSLNYIQMVQSQDAAQADGNSSDCPAVSDQEVTPSLLDPVGFNVAYGDTMPPPP